MYGCLLRKKRLDLESINFSSLNPIFMAYKKREPAPIVNKATTRLAAMVQIDTNHAASIDYGGPLRGALTSTTLQTKLINYAAKLQEYNQLLQQADTIGNTLKDIEDDIASDFTAVLKAAAGKFGENSNEVEMLGGTRKDERKKRKIISKKAA